MTRIVIPLYRIRLTTMDLATRTPTNADSRARRQFKFCNLEPFSRKFVLTPHTHTQDHQTKQHCHVALSSKREFAYIYGEGINVSQSLDLLMSWYPSSRKCSKFGNWSVLLDLLCKFRAKSAWCFRAIMSLQCLSSKIEESPLTSPFHHFHRPVLECISCVKTESTRDLNWLVLCSLLWLNLNAESVVAFWRTRLSVQFWLVRSIVQTLDWKTRGWRSLCVVQWRPSRSAFSPWPEGKRQV